MSSKGLPKRLDSDEALASHLENLLRLDPSLYQVAEIAGPVTIRATGPGFAGMARVICGQQLSVASARAIWARYEQLQGALDPQGYLALDEAVVRAAGMSSGKCR